MIDAIRANAFAIRVVLLTFCVCAYPGISGAQAIDIDLVPSGYNWQRIKTEHFNVYFLQQHRTQAGKAAELAEQVHQRLLLFMKWRPGGRTNLILTDHLDQANAVATAFPRRTILVYLHQPGADPGNYSDWMEEALVHEYAHILSLDMSSGFPEWLSSIFGRLFLPNAVQPMFQLEGIAVYAESRYTEFGRNNGALYRGLLRAFVLDSAWISLDQACVFRPEWPYDAPYLFGGMFDEYLAVNYGRNKLAEYQKRHSGLVFPFMQNRPAKKTFGKTLPVLWNEWRAASYAWYSAEIESLKATVLSDLTPLTLNGCGKYGLAVSRDKKRCAYVQKDAHDLPRLVLYDFSGNKPVVLARGQFTGSISFSPDGKALAYSKHEYIGNGNRYYSDFYILDIASRHENRLSRGLRATDPVFSPDGKSLYFVTQRGGAGALGKLDLADYSYEYITSFSDSCIYSHPVISPNGQKLAVSCWTSGGFWDIYVYEMGTGEFRPVTIDRCQDLWPGWSDDGKRILFASDRLGTWNIWEYDTDGDSMHRLTNVVGGAMMPAYLSEDSLVFINVSSKGYDIVVARGNHNVSDFENPACEWPIEAESGLGVTTGYKINEYNPWSCLGPVLWFPSVKADENSVYLGASCWGWDDLMLKSYNLKAIPAMEKGRFYYDLKYSDRSCVLGCRLNLADMPYSYDVVVGGIRTIYWQREQDQTVKFSLPFRRTGCQTVPYFQYHHVKLSPLNFNGPYRPFWGGNLADLTLGIGFNNAKQYGRSISPEKGRSLSTKISFYRKPWGSDVTQTVWLAEWFEYVGLPASHQVLMMRSRFGVYDYGTLGIFSSNDLFELRGCSQQDIQGRRKAAATIEYRFPLWYTGRGVATWPIHFDNLNGALFYDAGSGAQSWNGLKEQKAVQSLGLEVKSDWQLFYALPWRAILGLSYRLDSSRRASWYLTFRQDKL